MSHYGVGGEIAAFAYDADGRVTRTNFPSSLSENYQYDADDKFSAG